jgi:4-hydroxythreonine-4-phosphate dehydrogenase
MNSQEKIRIAISCGDINGVGLEVALKSLSDSRIFENCTPIIYANERTVKFHMKRSELELPLHVCANADKSHANKVNVINVFAENVRTEFGQLTQEAGQCAFTSLKAAVEDLASNKVDAIVTAPINKSNIQSEEFKFPGHTEFLAAYANEDNPLMILAHEELRVALVTGHVSLKDVSRSISRESILTKLEVFAKSLNIDFGINRPKIAVLSLNPHSGDKGLLGEEEIEIIAPAIAEAKDRGILAFGPFASDGFFGSKQRENYDGVLAMYHDQGLAPFKALAFDGVNFTAGLPIVRTSPDHGTAFDIAGKGVADPTSFRNAIFLACDIYNCRKFQRELQSNQLQTASDKAY